MSGWEENLLNNLLVVGILGAITLIAYMKIKNQTIGDIIRDIKGAADE